MFLVRQKYRHDCGIAVAAMVAGVPYEAVLDRLVVGLSPNNYLWPLSMWRTLEDLTQAQWHLDELWKPWPLVNEWPIPQSPTVLLIERVNPSRHYIAVKSGLVYDPLFGKPFLLAEYPDRNSWVVTTFTRKTVGCIANSFA
jgi:hypothetical protein